MYFDCISQQGQNRNAYFKYTFFWRGMEVSVYVYHHRKSLQPLGDMKSELRCTARASLSQHPMLKGEEKKNTM